MENKQRIIQELVPGKQITLAHIIANPDPILYQKLGLNPAVEYAKDRFSGSVIVTGTVSEVEASIQAILQYVENTLGYAVTPVTRT